MKTGKKLTTIFRLPAVLLAVLILFTAAACGNADTPAEDTTLPEAVTTEEATTVEETLYAAPPVRDLGNYKFRIFCSDNELWVPMHFSEAKAETGEIINDALYLREMTVEDKYNCTLTFTINDSANTLISTNVLSGSDICDGMFLPADEIMPMALNGVVLDFSGLEGLSLDQPWWDQRIQKEYRIGTHLFTVDGEINIRDDLRTMVIVYNKVVYDNYGYNGTYGTPYTMVSEGKWNLDMLLTMIDGMTEAPRNDAGRWGMLSENAGPYTFFLGTGLKTVSNDGGQVAVHLQDETVANALAKVLALADNPDVMICNNGTHFIGGSVWSDVSNVFKEGRALFRSTTLSAVNRLIDMVDDYGILPIPNAGDSNEYHCYCAGSENSPLAMPSNLEDRDKAAAVAEALAYYSLVSDTENIASLHEAFYVLMGDARLARNYEDTAMLDIIFSSKTFDIDEVSEITGFESAFYNLAKNAQLTSLSSTIKSYSKKAEKTVGSYYATIEEKYGN